MNAPLRKSSVKPVSLEDLDQLFPTPRGLRKDDERQFRNRRQQIVKSVEPENFLEISYANEMAHLLWQIRENLTRIASLIENAREEGLMRLLSGRCDNLPELVKAARRRDQNAMKAIGKHLEQFGLTEADVDAHAYSAVREEVSELEHSSDTKRDQFDRLVLSFEKRRFMIAERLRRLADIPPTGAPLLPHNAGKDKE